MSLYKEMGEKEGLLLTGVEKENNTLIVTKTVTQQILVNTNRRIVRRNDAFFGPRVRSSSSHNRSNLKISGKQP